VLLTEGDFFNVQLMMSAFIKDGSEDINFLDI
jgi:hypothetical protein